MRLLLIEDDRDLIELYHLRLKRRGHQVVEAADAQTALDRLEDGPIDAIVLDILLPHANGLSVLYELRSYHDWRPIPVIILSSLSRAEIGLRPQQMNSLGVVAYIDKTHPDHDLLGDTLERLVRTNG